LFEIGQKVVYPNHGVSIVEDIANDAIDGVEQTYYHLRVLSNDSKVMVPEENLDLVGLRPLCRTKDIKDLFSLLEDGNIDTYKDWKGRYKQNLDKMKTGRLTDVAEVLKNLRLVSQKQEPVVPREEDVRAGEVLHRQRGRPRPQDQPRGRREAGREGARVEPREAQEVPGREQGAGGRLRAPSHPQNDVPDGQGSSPGRFRW
jgi:CarD family transcriptional regulator